MQDCNPSFGGSGIGGVFFGVLWMVPTDKATNRQGHWVLKNTEEPASSKSQFPVFLFLILASSPGM